MSEAKTSTTQTSDIATICAHVGGDESAHVSPLVLASVMDFHTIESSLGPMEGAGYVYRRNGTPNGDELATAVAALEGAERGVATGSGMAAISAALLSQLKAGDAVVIPHDCYGGVRALAQNELTRAGIEVRVVEIADAEALAAALTGARVAFFETVSNPLLSVPDIGAAIAAARERGAITIVDNTFSTPLRDRPIEVGADLVVHSVTKFLSGHHDVIAGVIVGRRDLVLTAGASVVRLGLQASPLDCWLAVRGMRTLALRLERAWANAALVAGALRERYESVYSADRCALVSFDAGSFDAANELVSRLSLITLSPSLGGVATTASHPATSSHRALSREARAAAGIGDGLLRLSIGIENAADIVRDLAP